MKVIWKYPLHELSEGIPRKVTVKIPVGAIVLAVQTQQEIITLWALTDPKEDRTEERHFFVKGTGESFGGGGLNYIGTTQTRQGLLVWHIFEQVDG